MGLDPFSAVAGVVGKVIDRVFPDPVKKAEAILELEKLKQSGELQILMGQIEINKIEAASSSKWTSGWRPAVGWVCVAGLAMVFLIAPIGEWGTALAGRPTPFPKLDIQELMVMLAGMLGLSGLRTFEKSKGVAA